MAGKTVALWPAGPAGPTTGTEGLLADVLADVLHVEKVLVDDHFFDDLGADSMVLAHFCARIRKRADLPSVSMKDVYAHPTIRSLAASLGEDAPAPVEPAPVPPPVRTSTTRYVICGILQLALFVGYTCLAAFVAVAGFEWISAGPGLLEIYVRSAVVGSAAFLGMCLLPILVKWVLVGRWKPRQIRAWSLAYFRFWTVKTLVRANPLVLFAGSPLYVLYLRALGARIGPGVVILARSAPVCTDLLTVGAGTVIRKDALIACYRAHAGMIQTGRVTLGADVLVSEASVLDIGTSMGDGAQLGHVSSLHAGQAVPAGERWHGSPAQRTDVDFRTVPTGRCGLLRRIAYPVLQLLTLFLVYLPLGIGGMTVLLMEVPQLAVLLHPELVGFATWTFYGNAMAISALLLVTSMVVGLVVVATVPRVLNLFVRPDRVHRLYGVQYAIHRAIAGFTNIKFFKILFGDSSAIVDYLVYIGYDLGRVEQTGSNFGSQLKHDSPYLSAVGTGTMVADGLSMINAEYSSTSFRVRRTAIGDHNFLGNHIFYPAGARTGANCLLGTKVMVPIDGPVRHDVGLLGSPSFEIPRTVERDTRFDHLRSGDGFRRRLARKNRHNAVTATGWLFVRWLRLFGVTLLMSAAAEFYHLFGAPVIALAGVLSLVFTVGTYALVERAVTVVHPLRPLSCSIYDIAFWRHERFWKAASGEYMQMFNGTPFKALVWRLLGVKVGRRLFDDGCGMPERTLVTIGDDVTLNAASHIQCHSQEDGAFKSDRITIGSGCTIGVGAWVHYGVTMGDGVVLAPDSFLMKGEDVPAHTRWGGNPARAMPEQAPPLPAAPARRPRSLVGVAAAVPLVAVACVAVVADRGPDAPAPSALVPQGPIAGSAVSQPPVPAPSPAVPAPAVPAPAAPAPAAPAPAAPPVAAAAPDGPPPSAEPEPDGGAGADGSAADDLEWIDAGLRLGSQGSVVVTLQRRLQLLGHEPGRADGWFGEETRAAVRDFQWARQVTGDPVGTVGRPTAVALLAAGSRPQLAPGASGEDVARLQQALAAALARPLPATGLFDDATAVAVRDYQATRGLAVDGVAGGGTWAALQRGR